MVESTRLVATKFFWRTGKPRLCLILGSPSLLARTILRVIWRPEALMFRRLFRIPKSRSHSATIDSSLLMWSLQTAITSMAGISSKYQRHSTVDSVLVRAGGGDGCIEFVSLYGSVRSNDEHRKTSNQCREPPQTSNQLRHLFSFMYNFNMSTLSGGSFQK